MDSQRLADHRAQFPALQGKLYANFGVVGPMARSTLDALAAHYESRQREGPASPPLFARQAEEDESARRDLAALLEVAPAELALLDSTCTGCAAALLSVTWRPGDHLLLSDAEYPALVQLARVMTRRFAIEVTVAPLLLHAHDAAARIDAALRPRTRAVLLSHVLWTSGERVALDEVAALLAQRAPRPLLIVDGAQGPGNVAVRPARDGVDAYAFPGHKALCGPDGLGALWISPRVLEELEPLTAGWRGVAVDARGQATGPAPGARRFEMATTTFGTRPALRAALRVAAGFAPLAERVARAASLGARAFSLARESGLEPLLADAPGTPLVCLKVPGRSGGEVASALLAENIFVRYLPQTDAVRLSLSYLNTEDEVDAAIAALARQRRQATRS